MRSKDFTKEKKRIWSEVEAEAALSFPITRVFKDWLEQEEVDLPEDYGDGDSEEEQAYLSELRGVAQRYLAAFQLVFEGKPSHSNNDKPSKARRTYSGPFERRLRLVEFATDVWARDSGTRFNWKRIAAEWNEANPLSPTLSSNNLKREYYRAIQEDGIMIQLVVMQGYRKGYKPSKEHEQKLNEKKQFLLRINEDMKAQDGEPYLNLMYKNLTLLEKGEASRRHAVLALRWSARLKEAALRRRKEMGLDNVDQTVVALGAAALLLEESSAKGGKP